MKVLSYSPAGLLAKNISIIIKLISAQNREFREASCFHSPAERIT